MTNPLFVADLATLQKKLRLSAVPLTSEDALAILDESILRARLAFYRRLGEERVEELVDMTFTENPTDEEGILRALANTVEVKLVKCELLKHLPHAWMDSSGDVNKRWNEEAPVRERPPAELEAELLRCMNEIEADMQVLAGEEELGDECHLQVFDGSPKCPAPKVGLSLKNPRKSKFSVED